MFVPKFRSVGARPVMAAAGLRRQTANNYDWTTCNICAVFGIAGGLECVACG